MTAMAMDLAAGLDPVVFGHRTGFDAEEWQSRLLRSQARRILVASARQVGKTHTTAIRGVHRTLYEPDSLALLISPSQRQSNEMLRRCRQVFRQAGSPLRLVADSAEALEFENGSRVVSLPGTDATTRGFSRAKLLVIDEAARLETDVFHGVLPMVAADGVLMALSTPWGQSGWFFELWDTPGNGWERHRVTVHESGQWTEQMIAEVRASVGSHVFAADYEAEFQDTDQQLFSSQAVRSAASSAVAPLFGGGIA